MFIWVKIEILTRITIADDITTGVPCHCNCCCNNDYNRGHYYNSGCNTGANFRYSHSKHVSLDGGLGVGNYKELTVYLWTGVSVLEPIKN